MKRRGLLSAALLLSEAAAVVYPTNHELFRFDYLSPSRAARGVTRPLTKRDRPIPLIVTNNCPDVLWPGIASQAGEAPETHGFELGPGWSRNLTVGPTWAGRVWGRTNCTVGGDTATCQTGDCLGKLNCAYGGDAPATLAEFNLAGGVNGAQTFYDISLVDGYNLPLGIVYHPAANTSFIPPNLVNPTCIATAGFLSAPSRAGLTYTNATYPMPYEPALTNRELADWCPWDLQAFPPSGPWDGVYPYPDEDGEDVGGGGGGRGGGGGLRRPVFDPCMSACTSSHAPRDCCTGRFGHPDACRPSRYSTYAKTVCPDAYSYAFDDAASTFIVPLGGGWEVVFCPEGRSTNILATSADAMRRIADGGIGAAAVDVEVDVGPAVVFESRRGAAPDPARRPPRSLAMWISIAAMYLLLFV
ncbi:thaumatin family protein [Xylaria palmicola]|nr:thaumatin family protein [Xylaria palmicola]